MGEAKPKLPKYGIQVKAQWNCKICQSPHRAEIEDVLYLRSAGELLPNGVRPTERWVLENCEKLWSLLLNTSNIHTHYKKHFRPTGPGAAADVQRASAAATINAEEVERVQVDDFLQGIVDAAALKAKITPAAVTVDHGLKAAAELTRRKVNDRDTALLQILGGAVQQALTPTQDAPPADDVIEAEIVAEIPPPEAPGAESP